MPTSKGKQIHYCLKPTPTETAILRWPDKFSRNLLRPIPREGKNGTVDAARRLREKRGEKKNLQRRARGKRPCIVRESAKFRSWVHRQIDATSARSSAVLIFLLGRLWALGGRYKRREGSGRYRARKIHSACKPSPPADLSHPQHPS